MLALKNTTHISQQAKKTSVPQWLRLQHDGMRLPVDAKQNRTSFRSTIRSFWNCSSAISRRCFICVTHNPFTHRVVVQASYRLRLVLAPTTARQPCARDYRQPPLVAMRHIALQPRRTNALPSVLLQAWLPSHEERYHPPPRVPLSSRLRAAASESTCEPRPATCWQRRRPVVRHALQRYARTHTHTHARTCICSMGSSGVAKLRARI